MKKFIVFAFLSVDIMLMAQSMPPTHFRFGEYRAIYTDEHYDINSDFCRGWCTHDIEETITLHSDGRYEYRKYIIYQISLPREIIYSFGTWTYQDSIFYLESGTDTLLLNKQWREKQKIAYNPVAFFERMEPYKFREMRGKKLYCYKDCELSWQDECSHVVMRYESRKKEDFGDFLYSFINDSVFRNTRMGIYYSDCYVPIYILSPQNKLEVIVTCPYGNEAIQTDSIGPLNRIYKSLDESPYAFQKLPADYSFSKRRNLWHEGEYECTFESGDEYLFTMYFTCVPSFTWELDYIVIEF